MNNPDRKPMLLRNGIDISSHYYDEDIANREELPNGVSIRRYVRSTVRRPTRWQVGVIRSTPTEELWIGGLTVFDGFHNAYVRGPAQTSRRVEITGMANQAEALAALRWAIAHLYP